MTIVAEVVRGIGPREPLVKVKLAALPRAGERLYVDESWYEVAEVEHYGINVDPPLGHSAYAAPDEPFVIIVVKW